MMNHLNLTRKARKFSLLVAVGLLGLAGTKVAAGSAPGDTPDTYTWSAELVALDEMAKTITVKSRVVSHAEVGDLSAFTKGDHIMLTWSGAYGSASGVRYVTHDVEAKGELYTMPVEFVSSELDGRYITFKVPIPSSDVENIKSLMPGVWVRAMSPQQPSGLAEAIAEIRPYVTAG